MEIFKLTTSKQLRQDKTKFIKFAKKTVNSRRLIKQKKNKAKTNHRPLKHIRRNADNVIKISKLSKGTKRVRKNKEKQKK